MTVGLVIVLSISFSIILGLEAQRANQLKNELKKSRTSYTGRADAQVLSVEIKRVNRSKSYYYPEFSFVVDNKAYGVSQMIYSDSPNTFRSGTWLTVRYRLENPEDFMPENDEALWKMVSDTTQANTLLIILLVVAALAAPLLF